MQDDCQSTIDGNVPVKNSTTSLETLSARVSELSAEHVTQGGLPFGALIVDPQYRTLATGFNRVIEDHDPTAHAEIVACRLATKHLALPSLAGCTLIASGEPCGMCYLVARYFGIEQIVFAVDRHGAASAGFDYRHSYESLASDPTKWQFSVNQIRTRHSWAPFRRFRESRSVD